MSKLTFFAFIALAQSALLLVTVRYATGLTGGLIAQFLVVASTPIVGVALGLAVSAFARTSERAMTLLPVLLIAQAIFSGGLARLTGVVKLFSQATIPAYWSLDGFRSTFSSDLANATYPGAPGSFQPPILGPGGPIVVDVLALGIQATLLFVVTRWLLNRRHAMLAD